MKTKTSKTNSAKPKKKDLKALTRVQKRRQQNKERQKSNFQKSSKTRSKIGDEKITPTENARKVQAKPGVDDAEKLARTVFVGNWPLEQSKERLEKYFGKFGKLESCRFRSWPIDDTRLPKKVAVIRNKFHEQRTSTNAYIVYESLDSVETAKQANGNVFKGHHLRVSSAADKTFDHSKAIFVGNLPFGVEDEELWTLFSDCGEIEAVHIIRDKHTGIGRGFAYVNFTDAACVELALKFDQMDVQSRQIRVTRSNPGGESKRTGSKWKPNRNDANTSSNTDKLKGKRDKLNFVKKANFQGQKAHRKVKTKKNNYKNNKLAKKFNSKS